MLLADKVAIVTGGGRGIGLATARLFATEGAAVTVAGRDVASGSAAADGIVADGGRAIFVRTDVSIASDVEAMVAATVAAFGGVDVLVNNAGIDPWKPLLEMTEAEWDACIDINLKGHFLCARAVVSQMLARGGGAIVNTSSILALGALPRSGAYVASKAGIMGLTRAMATEWTPLGIRVNCVLPGSTDTDMMWMGLTPDEIPAERVATAATLPIGRIADPDEIAQASLWFASGRASFASGAFLVVDGGILARSPAPR